MSAAEESLKCWGCVLLIFAILGGIFSPMGSLWAFIIGCSVTCCYKKGDYGCIRCVATTGIVFVVISEILLDSPR